MFSIAPTASAFQGGYPFVEKINWAKEIGKDGRPVFDPANRPGDPKKSADGKKGSPVFAVPSFLGGKNQMPMAYSPQTGLFYVPANEWGMDLWNEPVAYKKGAAYLGAGFTIKPVFDDHIGALKAIDPMTGKIVWSNKSKSPLWGGVLTTAGGLVFYGTPEGDLKGARRCNRQGALELQYRFRHRCASDHLGTGRRADDLGHLRLGWRCAALGRRSRQDRIEPQSGRYGLDLQASKEDGRTVRLSRQDANC